MLACLNFETTNHNYLLIDPTILFYYPTYLYFLFTLYFLLFTPCVARIYSWYYQTICTLIFVNFRLIESILFYYPNFLLSPSYIKNIMALLGIDRAMVTPHPA